MTTPVSNSSNNGLLPTTDIATTQNTSDVQTPGATCFNRSVKCIKPSVSINIDRSEKRKITFSGFHASGLENRVVLKYIPFEIDGSVFDCIDGNERDNELAEKMIDISDDWPRTSFSFTIKTQDGNHDYKPSLLWQERLLRCINVGLQSLFDDCPPDRVVPLLGNKTVAEIYKGKKTPVVCHQFVNFMEFNSTSFLDKFSIKFTNLKSLDINNQFTPITILKNNDIVHTFIHIGNNICISKVGDGNIFFHTAEDILSLYQEYFETPLSLAIATIQPLQ
ncbi:hypothetical protein [Endozoicomonas sp. 4G]|uniref:hypothetical protein n=1 Tax=Endozoicomonas sp. 4G TaxID=2872754 RepID=UPI0020787A9F|nr:hypothetical protein [Endozoicomonas sp. 4G]